MHTHLVIMAGGVGSRLWPVSTPQMPKQFMDLLGMGKTLLQLTADRFSAVCPPERTWVVTSERYVSIVQQQLPQVPRSQILAEPVPRNTAPCIAYASWKIAREDPAANIVVTPADALVLNTSLFTELMGKALACTAGSRDIVTVGIVPTRPETGYGYIHAADARPGEVVPVSAFREKPDLATARAYLADGHYYWNAGIFVWQVTTILQELRTHAPQIAGVMDQLAPTFGTPREQDALQQLFPTCDKVSIDYAVMEKSQHIRVIAGDLGWSDLGSWSSVKDHLPADGNGNVTVGTEVRLFGCTDCLVHATGGQTVVVEGLEGYIVAASGNRVLICRRSEEQHIREYAG